MKKFSNIKLVATDMDGTLLNNNKQMPKDFIPWVKTHKDIIVVIASGRQYYALKRDFSSLKDDLVFIAENGSLVFAKDKIIYKNLMNKDDITLCLKMIEKIPYAHPVLCGVDGAYILKDNNSELKKATMYYEKLYEVSNLYQTLLEKEIVKLAIYFNNTMAEVSIKYFSSLPSHLKAVVSGISWIDIASSSANKGVALKAIQQQYNIKENESMAFGDYFNDVEMLQCCKYSFAMENAHPDVKPYANYITTSNEEDGVMNILREI